MDILEEIDETIKDKKGKWNYTPMREKSETDILIDELLKEFSADSGSTLSDDPSFSIQSEPKDYNVKTEMEERIEYENSVSNSQISPDYQPERKPFFQSSGNDETQIFSRTDIGNYEETSADNNFSKYNGSQNDDYDDFEDGGFDDDYYDENDFNEDCDNLSTDQLDEEEYAEFEEFIDQQDKDGLRIIKPKAKINMPKTIFRIFYTAVIAAFTIIGILSTAIYCLEQLELTPSDVQKEEDALKEELSNVVFPFVFTAIDDFDSAENISKEQLVNLSIWEIIINLNGNLSVFEESETGKIIIPQSQVEYAAEKLLGDDQKVETCNIKYADLEIKYDEDKKGYVIPDNYNIYTFYPVVTSVKNQDETYTVNVDCFSDFPAWTEGKKKTPAKKMIFTLKKTSDYYNIISAKTVK